MIWWWLYLLGFGASVLPFARALLRVVPGPYPEPFDYFMAAGLGLLGALLWPFGWAAIGVSWWLRAEKEAHEEERL